MRRAFLIGHNDARMFLRPKSSYIWLVVMPLAFVYFLGMAFKGPDDPANPRPSVRIENLDTNFLSRILLEKLNSVGMNVVSGDTNEEAKRVIRIPKDFTENVLNKKQAKIQFFKAADSGDQSAMMIEMRLLRGVIGLNSDLIQWAGSSGGEAVTEENLRQLLTQEPPVQLQSSFAGRNPIPSGYEQSLPANMVMFVMLNLLIFGGSSVARERESGVLRRLVVHPVTRFELIMGKVYGRFLLGLFQVVVFMTAGRFLFHVRFGNEPWVVFFGLLIFCWVAASIGLLLGSLIRGEEKIIGICTGVGMVMGALGGCWWPMEIVSDSMRIVGHVTPTAWAMDFLHQLISYGGGPRDVLLEVGVLLGFAAVSNALAAKFFRC